MPITKATASSVAPAAKGDLVVGSATNDASVLGVGSNDQVLTADSSTATGLKWATASSGGMTLINTGGTTLTGSSITISSIPTTYTDLYVIIRDYRTTTNNDGILVRFNSDSSTKYGQRDQFPTAAGLTFNLTRINICEGNSSTTANSLGIMQVFDYANTTTYKMFNYYYVSTDGTSGDYRYRAGAGLYNSPTTAISSLNLIPEAGGTFSDGIVYVYGVK